MEVINGQFFMCGVREDDPGRICTVQELIKYVNKVGFLPLFQNEIEGFSVEEKTFGGHWWNDDPETDPWKWREIAAESGKVIYGKFFNKKAGFISKKWFPTFANWRRNGYDFDARWDDGETSVRHKKIMDCFLEENEIMSPELKEKAGFYKGGEKNFEGIVTDLQMQMYLCDRRFARKVNKKGQEYGWSIAVYCTPENLWGYDLVSSAYSEDPAESKKKVYDHIKKLYKKATNQQLQKVLGR